MYKDITVNGVIFGFVNLVRALTRYELKLNIGIAQKTGAFNHQEHL